MRGYITKVVSPQAPGGAVTDINFQIEGSVFICKDENYEVQLYSERETVELEFQSYYVSRRVKDGELNCVEISASDGQLYVTDHGATWKTTLEGAFDETWTLGEVDRLPVEGNTRIEIGNNEYVHLETRSTNDRDITPLLVRERAKRFGLTVEGEKIKRVSVCQRVGRTLLRSMKDCPMDSSEYDAVVRELAEFVGDPATDAMPDPPAAAIQTEGLEPTPTGEHQHRIAELAEVIEEMYTDASV